MGSRNHHRRRHRAGGRCGRRIEDKRRIRNKARLIIQLDELFVFFVIILTFMYLHYIQLNV